ncbi:MAG TPA: antibiotic biosynthesis monooxygenase [Candidatus Polarisedimenticolaceae bacterium]|nr:antibiotic biosynthesis monooxygenase [Candidatus Polarisedimenticolaceae bacterium]
MAQANNFSNEPVTTVLSWTVKPGKEQLFEQMMHDIHKVARTFPGHMGVTTLKSPENKESFQTVLRFDTTRHLENWLNSPIRRKMIKPMQEIAHTDATAKATGLETWFDIPGHLVAPPPRWKMVITTFIAIYPLSLLFSLFLTPYIANWPLEIRAIFLPVFAPIILTYLFMPFLTQRVLKRWLYKAS